VEGKNWFRKNGRVWTVSGACSLKRAFVQRVHSGSERWRPCGDAGFDGFRGYLNNNSEKYDFLQNFQRECARRQEILTVRRSNFLCLALFLLLLFK